MAYNSSDYKTRIEIQKYFGVSKEVGEKRKLQFRFLEPNEHMPVPTDQFKLEIEEMIDNCGCTVSAITDTGIEVTYENKGTNESEAKLYEGRFPYETTITVYFRDGKPLKKLNPRGELVYNQEKARVYLAVFGTIAREV